MTIQRQEVRHACSTLTLKNNIVWSMNKFFWCFLWPYYSKCAWGSSIGITWELLQTDTLRTHLDPTNQNLHVNKIQADSWAHGSLSSSRAKIAYTVPVNYSAAAAGKGRNVEAGISWVIGSPPQTLQDHTGELSSVEFWTIRKIAVICDTLPSWNAHEG